MKKTWGKTFNRWLWRLFLFTIYCFVLYQLWLFSHVLHWNTNNPASSAFMAYRLSILRAENPEATLSHNWVAYQNISYEMKRAIIVAEDGKFTQHEGFDYQALQNAFKKNLEKWKFTVGGSTITQQLAKNLFLSANKTVWRKLQEALITIMIEYVMPKQRILEIYLNIIEWGVGVFGVEAASQHFFNTSASQLTAKQATYLAAMVTNPRFYDKNRQSTRLLKKQKIFLKRLHSAKIP